MKSWTPQQSAVFEAVAGGQEHLACTAVAGAGKSTTAVEASRQSGAKSVGFVAFNNHIAAELAPKLNGSASACTLHALGRMAVTQACPSADLDEDKPRRLLQVLRPHWFFTGRNGKVYARDEGQACLQLTKLVKYTLTPETDRDGLEALVDHYGIDISCQPTSILNAVPVLIEAELAEPDRFDFDDMVWLPVRRNLAVGGFDLLFVDEAQDLSKCQQALARKAGERLCVIGDERQAIYGFTGSDCDALPRMVQELGAEASGCEERPLTVTFRCPVSHVELARQLVPTIEPATNAVQGIVTEIDPDDTWVELMAGDLAICRCNGPLVDLAYQLITQNVPCVMRGRDIGRNLLELVSHLKASDPQDLARKLVQWEEREIIKLDRRNAPESEYQSLTDRVLCLDTLATHSASLSELRATVEALFSDDTGNSRGKVMLSSVHRAKGLEADRVVIIDPEKLPLVRKDQRPWQYKQELNLVYIAVTRARQELIFAGDVPALFRRTLKGVSS